MSKSSATLPPPYLKGAILLTLCSFLFVYTLESKPLNYLWVQKPTKCSRNHDYIML